MRPAAASRQQTGRPALLQAMIDAFRVPDLRAKILFTIMILVLFRFIAHVPVPGAEREALAGFFNDPNNQLFGLLDIFSGGALRNLSIAALGVYPYITASIVMQLMVPVIPGLKNLSQEGEWGRQRINQITHLLAVPVAMAQGYGQLLILQQAGVFGGLSFSGGQLLTSIAIILGLAAGTMLLVWMGELITERGIGNGISLIIFAGVVAGFPQLIQQGYLSRGNLTGLLVFVAIGLGLIFLIVIFNEAERRIPVQYGRSVFQGGRMYRQGGATHLPIRVNSAGMIPLIFAFSVVILPGTIASYFAQPGDTAIISRVSLAIYNLFNSTGPVYWIAIFILVVAFAFFYTIVVFQQQDLAKNLQRNGGFVPGIRPGRPTSDYLNRIILRVTWGGAFFLGFVAVAPYLASLVTSVNAITLSSTALLILVGVALDTMRQLEAQLMMRNYEGFLK